MSVVSVLCDASFPNPDLRYSSKLLFLSLYPLYPSVWKAVAMTPPCRALIAVTSANASLFEGGGHITGVFIGEALHPYNVLKAAGFEVDIASEKGTWTADWLSPSLVFSLWRNVLSK